MLTACGTHPQIVRIETPGQGLTPMPITFRAMLVTDTSDATSLFVGRYRERRSKNPLYPPTLISDGAVLPLISEWLSTGHGVVAEQDGEMVGYLLGRETTGMGGINMSFTPEWAHATKAGSSGSLTGDLYTSWCRISERQESTLHMTIVFADELDAHDCFVQKGFGRFSGGHAYDLSWITEPTKSIWVSREGDAITGFMSAEYGPQRPSSLKYSLLPQIEGAFLDPSFRGSGSANALLDALLGWVSETGSRYCTVDFETANPEGSTFWFRNDFEPLLITMTRRLDARYGT